MLNVWPTHEQPLLHDVSLVTEGPTYPPTGERRVWPFRPAWPPAGDTVQETYSFKTEILVSRSGREKRLARRAEPRKEIQQAVFLAGDRLRQYKDLMWAWQHRDLVLTDLFRSIDLPDAMPAGTGTLVLDDPPPWMLPGAAVVIGNDENREALEIAGVAGDATYFKEGVTREWPAGTPVYPGMIGNLFPEINADRATNDVAQGRVRFVVRPLSEVPRIPADPDLVFDGREVFTLRPNWAEQVSSALSHEVDILDYGTGPISRYAAQNFGRELTGATYLGTTRERVNQLLDLFWRTRGQQSEFWMPTWENDFVLRAAGASGGSTLRLKDTRVFDTYATSTTHKAIFVKLTTGTLLLNTVSSITTVDDVTGKDSVLNVGTAWPQGFAVDDVLMTGWLLLRRFASDSLTIEWLTNEAANVQVNLMSLEALPEETVPE